MPDITMCRGGGCERKTTCYRHNAKANEYRQSWFANSPVNDGKCAHYWPDWPFDICSEFDCNIEYAKKEGVDCKGDFTVKPCIFQGEHECLNVKKDY